MGASAAAALSIRSNAQRAIFLAAQRLVSVLLAFGAQKAALRIRHEVLF
jgi:hypothetical protein